MIDSEHMKRWCENHPHLVQVKGTSNPELFVLKYRKKVFFNDLWTRELEMCRGTVVDKDFKIIARPFTKVYNYGIEKRSPVYRPTDRVTVLRKVNGFMLAVSAYKGELLFSTTGTIDSDFAKMGKEMFFDTVSAKTAENLCNQLAHGDLTLMFECVHPDDPHIIPEENGLYYLGLMVNEWENYRGPSQPWIEISNFQWMNELGFKIPSMPTTFSVGEIQKLVQKVEHEGFMIYHAPTQTSAKLKSPYYLVKKLFARLTSTERLLNRGIEHRIDEEYYPLLEHLRENREHFMSLAEQDRLQYIRNYFGVDNYEKACNNT